MELEHGLKISSVKVRKLLFRLAYSKYKLRKSLSLRGLRQAEIYIARLPKSLVLPLHYRVLFAQLFRLSLPTLSLRRLNPGTCSARTSTVSGPITAVILAVSLHQVKDSDQSA